MFFGLWWAWYISITLVRHMNGLERWAVAKVVLWSAVYAVLSIITMTVFVLLF
jgi:hypothetical protein